MHQGPDQPRVRFEECQEGLAPQGDALGGLDRLGIGGADGGGLEERELAEQVVWEEDGEDHFVAAPPHS